MNNNNNIRYQHVEYFGHDRVFNVFIGSVCHAFCLLL